jgi:hypothetical protein
MEGAMYCSGCGSALEPGKSICPQCGRAVPPAVSAAAFVPGLEMQVAGYAGKVRLLGILWLVYGGISLIFGLIGIGFMRSFFAGGFGPWAHDPNFPTWIFPYAFHFAWVSIFIRVALCAIAGWGLLERTQWGRIVAIVAAILSLIHIPLGTALGIATMVILFGYRNWALYEQL